MTKFVGCYLTNGGLELINSTGAKSIIFTKAVTGSGSYEADEEVAGLTELKNQEQEFSLEELSLGDENRVCVKFKISNTGLEHDYNFSEVGVYARADGGDELLYCVAYALEGDTEVIPMPDGSTVYIMSVEVETVVSTSAAVSVVYSEERQWTMDYVGERIEEVTRKIPTMVRQLEGAITGVKGNAESAYRTGNVNLTATNIGAMATNGDSKNNTTTFTNADSTTATSWTDVAVLASGEKHSSIFNKISTMIKNIRFLYNNVGKIKGIIETLDDCTATTQDGYAASAKALSELNSKIIQMVIENIVVTSIGFDYLYIPFKTGYIMSSCTTIGDWFDIYVTGFNINMTNKNYEILLSRTLNNDVTMELHTVWIKQ